MKIQDVIAVKNTSTTHPVNIKEDLELGVGGNESYFIKIDDIRGIKLFSSEQSAKRSRRRQYRAWKHNIAPKPLSIVMPFSIGYRSYVTCKTNYRKVYGYLTQNARVKNPYSKCSICRDPFTHSAENRLADKLIKLNMGRLIGDLHEHNVGKIGNKWVIIDFGDLSYGNEKTFGNSPVYA